MADFFIQFLFFPAALVSLIFPAIGVVKDIYGLVLLGVALFLPSLDPLR